MPLSVWINNGMCCLWFISLLKKNSSALFLHVTLPAKNVGFMKIETLKKRLSKNRPMTSVTIRMPEDVVEDLKRIAPKLGFSGYQPLIRTYIGQGLRKDLERLENDSVTALINSLRRRGISDDVLTEALSESAHKQA